METKTEIAETQQQELAVEKAEEINAYQGASMLKITEDEQNKLLASFEQNEIEIRPDGLIYLPQAFWRKRLNQTFGIGQWCLLPKGNHQDNHKLYFKGVLMVRGHFVAEAVGEGELHPNNPMQSWASVWESAKSDCITRCCKDLGIASELWQPEFIQKWIDGNAVQVWREKTGKHGKDKKPGSFQWRKKTGKKFWDEKDGQNTAQPQAEKPPENPKKESEILTPDHKHWRGVAESLASGKVDFTEVRKHFGLSKNNQKELEKLAETIFGEQNKINQTQQNGEVK